MTFDEKVSIVSHNAWSDLFGIATWTGQTNGIERLKVPTVRYQDGPQGFRANIRKGTTTAWPSVLAYGTTWDPKVILEWGMAMGKEFKMKGAGVQLGPGMNLMRIGNDGRDFEYISGEDPFLGATLVG